MWVSFVKHFFDRSSTFYLRAPSNAVIGNCLSGMLSEPEWANRKHVGAQATFPRSISSMFYFSNPTAIDYAKDRLFPLKDRWETVAKTLMVDPIWLVGSFKSLASKGPTNFYPC
jgi:hypothetical protein